MPNDQELEEIYLKLKKDTEEKRRIDCVHYIKDLAYEEKDRTVELSEETTASISLMKNIAENVEKSLNQIIEE